MASTGFTLPGTGANNTDVGSEAWVNPGNITADDGTNSEGAPAKDEQMNYLVGSNFGFNIPSGSTINGIEARVQCFDGSIDASPAHLTHAIIGKSNAALGSDLQVGNLDVTGTAADYTYGSATELWGLTWTAAEINASTFQFRISMNSDGSSGAGDPRVDAMWVNIHYTPPVGTRFMIIG
jgi:hypothetical protein